METIKNVTQLFVGLADTNTAAIEGDTISAYGDMTDGEIVITDQNNVVLTASDNLVAADFPTQEFKFIGRSGTTLIHSDLISKANIISYDLAVQSAEVQQVDYVGYNGSAGSLGAIVSNLHTIRLYVQESTIQGFMQQKIKEGFYKSASTTTQQAIALGLCKSLVANYSREPEQDLKFERINAGAQANAMASATASVVNGSKYVTLSEDESLTCPAASLIRFGTSGAGVAPVYVVESISASGLIITLDMEYQGATETIAHTAVETVTEGNWGIKITGVDRAFKAGFTGTAPITWTTNIDFGDSSATTVTKSTAAYPGIGTPQQLARLEKELQADGNVYRSFVEGGVVDRSQMSAAVTAGTLSDVITITYAKEIETGLGSVVKSPATILLASVKASANTLFEDADSGLVVALDKIIVTNWATPGAATLQTSMT